MLIGRLFSCLEPAEELLYELLELHLFIINVLPILEDKVLIMNDFSSSFHHILKALVKETELLKAPFHNILY